MDVSSLTRRRSKPVGVGFVIVTIRSDSSLVKVFARPIVTFRINPPHERVDAVGRAAGRGGEGAMNPHGPIRRPTLRTLARELGLSVTTVSRALKDGPEVRPETVARVKAAAEAAGYRPDWRASALRTGRSGVLAVLFYAPPASEDVGDASVATLMEGICRRLGGMAYMPMVRLHATAAEGFGHVRRIVEEKLADGVCPTCGQEVHGEPDALREDRDEVDELEDRLEALENEVDELTETVEEAEVADELTDRIERLEADVESVEERVEKREKAHEEAMEDVEEAAGRVESLEDELDDAEDEMGSVAEKLEEARDNLEMVRERREEAELAERLVNESDSLEQRADSVEEVLEEKRERLAEKRDERDELRDRVGDIDVDTLREKREEARDYIERATDRLDALREERDEIQNAIGAVENELERLDELREEVETLEDRLESVEEIHDDAVSLKDTYASLRHELRTQNLRRLDELLNEVFEMVYANASYARVELDEDYEITVHEKDGTTLDPERLSGGERAVFNLSLRCAVYRLLVEGTGANAALPPLIFDEPTTFLDDEHVSRLIRLVRAMNDEYGVEQVIVVSHDPELLDAADSRIVVEKDPTTNRSRVVESADAVSD
ncbi:MAG: LacI family DNA-binding transcriptional regulator [Halobacteriales archaeon]